MAHSRQQWKKTGPNKKVHSLLSLSRTSSLSLCLALSLSLSLSFFLSLSLSLFLSLSLSLSLSLYDLVARGILFDRGMVAVWSHWRGSRWQGTWNLQTFLLRAHVSAAEQALIRPTAEQGPACASGPAPQLTAGPAARLRCGSDNRTHRSVWGAPEIHYKTHM